MPFGDVEASPLQPRRRLRVPSCDREVVKDEIELLMVATLGSKDSHSICSNFTLMANRSAKNTGYRADCLSVMEDNVEEIESFLENMPSAFPDYLALLFASTSGGGIAAHEVLELTSGGGRCIEALSRVVCNCNLENRIRASCLECMSELGVPATYLRDKREVTGGESGDMDIANLARLYTSNLNELVKTACESRFVLDVGHAASSLIKKFGSTDDDVELGLKIMEHLMNFIIRLMVHATENYAKLRLSLTEQSPVVVPLAILPFLEHVLNTPAGLLGPVFYRRLLFAIQSLAILTYKVKTVREVVGEEHEDNVSKTVRLIGEGNFGKHPELLAAMFKLHVNIEGGHGPKWSQVHGRVSSMLLGELGHLDTSRGGGIIFKRCVKHNVDGIPCNRASRAFDFCRPFFGEGGGGEEGAKTKKKKKKKKKGKRIKKKKRKDDGRGYEGHSGLGRGEEKEQEEKGGGEEEEEEEGEEEKSTGDSDDSYSKYDELIESYGERNVEECKVVDVSTLQLDELDDLFFEGTGLNVGRGPPPAKFTCEISGEVMHEPVQDPWCEEPRYYDKTSLVQMGESDDPFWPRTSEKIDVEQVLKMEVEKEIVNEIWEWKGRMV